MPDIGQTTSTAGTITVGGSMINTLEVVGDHDWFRINLVAGQAITVTVLPTNWQVEGTGDFNGDGRDDLVWRRDDGAFTTWLAQPNGGFVSNDANSWAVLPISWHGRDRRL